MARQLSYAAEDGAAPQHGGGTAQQGARPCSWIRNRWMIPDQNRRATWHTDPRLWFEAFVLVNLAFLALDIYFALSVNQFRRSAEYIPFFFSFCAPPVLGAGLVFDRK